MHPYSEVQSEGRGKGKSDGGDGMLPKCLWGHSLCSFCSHSSIETHGALQLEVTEWEYTPTPLCVPRKGGQAPSKVLLSLSAGCPGLGDKELIWPTC